MPVALGQVADGGVAGIPQHFSVVGVARLPTIFFTVGIAPHNGIVPADICYWLVFSRLSGLLSPPSAGTLLTWIVKDITISFGPQSYLVPQSVGGFVAVYFKGGNPTAGSVGLGIFSNQVYIVHNALGSVWPHQYHGNVFWGLGLSRLQVRGLPNWWQSRLILGSC